MTRSVANPMCMEATRHLATQVSEEQDDVLASIVLVQGDTELEDRLFERLVDLLVESLFLDLRRQYSDGELDTSGLTTGLAALALECRTAGLLPLPRRTP